jgi:multiple sugar transport system substrate-binding protein
MPLRTGLQDAYPGYFTENPAYAMFADMTSRTVEVPNVPNSIAIWQALRDAYTNAVVFGKADPAQALSDAAAKVDQLAGQS